MRADTRQGIAHPHGGLFVAGTDTGVGKTLVACAILHAMRRAGLAPVPFKPVASGCEQGPDGLVNDDTSRLIRASGRSLTQDAVSPFRYQPPVAPHIAAAAAGWPIDLDHLVKQAAQMAALGPLVVEGAGGFLVPVDACHTLADLAVRLGLPVVLVVGLRLGCINHALLSAEAVAARHLSLAGWVGNAIDPGFERLAENLDTLRARLPAPLLGVIPWTPAPDPSAFEVALPALQ
jgi:dethiobiotin synthetase